MVSETKKQWEAATDHEGRRPGTVRYRRPRNSGRLLPITRVGDQALSGTRTETQWETYHFEGMRTSRGVGVL
jgi:hypothetical protein